MADRRRALEDIVREIPAVCFLWRNSEGWPVELVTDNVAQFGYQPEDFLSDGLLYESIVHPDDRARVAAEVLRHTSAGDTYLAQEYRILTRDGEVRWLDDRSKVCRDESGAVTHFQGMVLDVTERKQAELAAEAALREADEKYRTLLEHSHDGIFLAQDGIIQFCNQALANMVGARIEEIQGHPLTELISPQDRGLVLQRHRQRLGGSQLPEAYEFRAQHRNGTTPVLVHMSVGLGAYQGRNAVIGTVRDITQERLQEIALRESESKYRSVIENIQDAFYRSDAEGRLVMASPSLARMLGYDSLEECVGRDIAGESYADPAARDALLRELEQTGSVTDYEVTLRRRDGSLLVVSTSSRVRYDDQGVMIGVEGIFRDVTQSKRAEVALREGRERLQQFLRGSPTPCFVIRPDHVVELWNDALAELTGIPAHQMVGTRDHWRAFYASRRPCLADLLVSVDTEAIERWYGPAITRSKLIDEAYTIEGFFPDLGRDGRWLHVTAAAVRDSTGVLIGAIETLEDITEHRRSDEQLRQAQRLESVGRLAAGVAHDFNNLLTPIMGYAGLMIAGFDPKDERRGHAEEIVGAARRCRDLTRQLLAFSRKQVLDLHPVDLRQVIEGLRSMLRRTLREDIDLRIEVAAEPCTVLADVGQLEQVLMNLVVNSQDAMPRGGSVTVAVKRAGESASRAASPSGLEAGALVELAVSDTGTGMDEHTREHAFEPFFTTKGPGAGTGLGLATVHGIVTQHGGTILLETSPGAGSLFRILLPANESQPRRAISEPPPPPRSTEGSSETILVVEDSAPVLAFTIRALQSAGYQVLSSSSGEQCLELLARHPGPVSLLLTDVVMPNMNGKELAEQVRGLFPGTPTLYMSGYPQDVIAEHGMPDGIDNLLRKPFSLQELTARVRAMIDEAHKARGGGAGSGDA